MRRTKVGIIGGGASGLLAAIVAASKGAEVTILEHKDRVGKKILMTGNGKCNLTNLHISPDFYYSHEKSYAMDILNQISPEQIITYFRTLGLYTKEKRDGGIYPIAEQAAVVLDSLLQACEVYHVEIIPMVNIHKIAPGKQVTLSGTLLEPDSKQPVSTPEHNVKKKKGQKEKPAAVSYHAIPFSMKFDQVILACGSKAASVTGSDGSGYELSKQLGLRLETVVPALVQLHCTGDFFKGIAGVRVEAEVSLMIDNIPVAKEYGELQITDYGISGIPVFQFSRSASYALLEHKKCEAEINLIPYSIFDTEEALRNSLHPDKTVLGWMEGFLNKKLALFFIKRNHMQPDQKTSAFSLNHFQELLEQIQHFKVTILKTNPFENAQVCAGGISLSECNMNLSLKKYPNIYAVGELLDVDGKCGGYNLHWAWVTGCLAGISTVEMSD